MKRLFSYEEIKTCSVSTDEVLHQLQQRNYSNARPRRSHTITRLLENNAYCYNDTINYDSFNAFFFEGVGGGGLLYLSLSTIAFRLEKHFEKFSSIRFRPTPPLTMLFLPCQKIMCGVGLFMEL